MTPAFIKNHIYGLWARLMEGGRLGFFLLAVAALGAFYSLYSSLKPERMLTIAVHHGVESVALKKVAERFSREHGITVRIEEFSYDDLFQREREQVRSHAGSDPEPQSAFDVILVDDPWMPALMFDVTRGKQAGTKDSRLKRLRESTYSQDGGPEDFVGETLKMGNFCVDHDPCSDYYGVPFVGNSQLFCYNKKLVTSPPTDWEEVMRDSAMAEGSNLGYVTRIGPDNSIVTDFMPILWSYDKDSFPESFHRRDKGSADQEDNKAFAHHEEAAKAFQAMLKLVKQQQASGTSVDDFDVSAYLSDGRASMGIVWSAWAMTITRIQNDQPVEDQKNLECGPMPKGKPELGVWLLAIPKTAAMQREAEQFVQYATSKEQLLIAAAEGNPPPRRSVLKNEPAAGERKPGGAHGMGSFKEDSRDFDCSRKQKSEDDFQKCWDRVHQAIQAYGELFDSQLQSLVDARPRPRSRCWKEMEQVLGAHLQKLIIANQNQSGKSQMRPLAEEIKDALNDAEKEMGPLIRDECPILTAKY